MADQRAVINDAGQLKELSGSNKLLAPDEGVKFANGSVLATGIHVGTSPPASPVDGMLWVDTN